jgi:hypothetical protein
MQINVGWKTILVALLLLLAAIFCGIRWYESSQALKLEKERALHNDIAMHDTLRSYKDFKTQYAFEHDLSDSLKKVNLRNERNIVMLNRQIIELGSGHTEVIHATDTLFTDSSATHVFMGTAANALIELKDSVKVDIKSVGVDSNKRPIYSWVWSDQISFRPLRQIEIENYLTQNSGDQYSFYFRTKNPLDSNFLAIRSLTTTVDLPNVNKRGFWQKLYIAPGLGFDMVNMKLLYGIMLYQEDWQLGVGYQNNGNVNIISAMYFTNMYKLFH